MKKYLILLLAVFLFSCAPKKVIQQSKTVAKIETDNNIKDSDKSQIDIKKTTTDTEKKTGKTKTTTTNYDTSKPKDPETGKPPISSESVTTNEEEENNVSATVIDSTAKVNTTHEDKSKANSQAKVDTTVKEIPKTPAIAYWFYIGIFVVVCVGLFFVRKYWTKIKSIFVK